MCPIASHLPDLSPPAPIADNRKDRARNNCRVFNVVITAERDDYDACDTCLFGGP